MQSGHSNLTATALIGAGAATLSVALASLIGFGGQLRAADVAREQAPVTTQELRDTLDQERRSPKWDGVRALPPAAAHRAATPTPAPHREL